MMKMTHKENSIKAWKRSTIALSLEVVHMRTRQDDLGANKTVATINTDLSVLETCWLEMKKDYIELNHYYPELRWTKLENLCWLYESQSISESKVSTEIRPTNC